MQSYLDSKPLIPKTFSEDEQRFKKALVIPYLDEKTFFVSENSELFLGELESTDPNVVFVASRLMAKNKIGVTIEQLDSWKEVEGLDQEEAIRRDMFFVARDLKEAQRRILYEETSFFRVFEEQKLVAFFIKLSQNDFELRRREEFKVVTEQELDNLVL